MLSSFGLRYLLNFNLFFTDIEEKYIAKIITEEDMIMMAKQLDHSMGGMMEYFGYVCVIMAAVLIYLLTKIIIEKNENAIVFKGL